MTVELCIANDQAIGHCDAHPAVLDHVDSESRFAGREIAVDFHVVIDATERGFDRWCNRFGICGRRGALQRSVFTYGKYNPAVRWWRCSLCETGSGATDGEQSCRE